MTALKIEADFWMYFLEFHKLTEVSESAQYLLLLTIILYDTQLDQHEALKDYLKLILSVTMVVGLKATYHCSSLHISCTLLQHCAILLQTAILTGLCIRYLLLLVSM